MDVVTSYKLPVTWKSVFVYRVWFHLNFSPLNLDAAPLGLKFIRIALFYRDAAPLGLFGDKVLRLVFGYSKI